MRRLLCLFCTILVLAGCGSEQAAAPITTPNTPTPAATTAASPTPEGDGALVPKGLKTGEPVDEIGRTNGKTLYGADISWPQCPKGMGIPQKRTLGAPLPTAAARFVIIGLTNGPSFTPNPCLADQVAWAKERKLLTAAYAVVSWPNPRTVTELGSKGPFGSGDLDRLRNVGHAAAGFTIDRMRRAGLRSPVVWVDVEPVRHFEWSGTTTQQAAVVEGTVRGYTDAGLRVGVYSTPAMYRAIVGDLRLGLPEWRAAGQTSEAEAVRRCAKGWSIQGGAAVFGQSVEDGRDRNVTCPGTNLELGDWFQQF